MQQSRIAISLLIVLPQTGWTILGRVAKPLDCEYLNTRALYGNDHDLRYVERHRPMCWHLRVKAGAAEDFRACRRSWGSGDDCDRDQPRLSPRSANLPLSLSPLHTIW